MPGRSPYGALIVAQEQGGVVISLSNMLYDYSYNSRFRNILSHFKIYTLSDNIRRTVMNLNSFLYVAEIERCGSINRAAQNLYTSQSNLSTALKSLEDELGYPIFKRTSNGSVPTPEGYLFIQSAKAILADPAACRHRRHHLHHLQLVSSDPSKPGRFQRAGSPGNARYLSRNQYSPELRMYL